jgi:Fic family protein
MKWESFIEGKATGQLVKIPEENVYAFVPGPLPPKNLEPSWELMKLNSDADRALSELAGLAQRLPNVHLLSGTFQRREAVLSSRIEGTYTTMQELFLFEAGGDEGGDVREVWNYVNALNHGLSSLEHLPICNRLIKEIHGKLMTGVRGGDKTPGEFRTRQNYIGARPTTKIQDATYVPPPVKEMLRCMNELEEFINSASELPPLVRESLIHYQFEAIHPFQDGNGRIGRLLFSLGLCAEKVVHYPLLYLSEFIEKRKDEYYSLLFNISVEGEWLPWIEFFLRAIIEQSKDAQSRANRLHDLMQQYRDRLMQMRAPASTHKVLEHLFHVPAISSVQATKAIGGQSKTGIAAIQRLMDAGILIEVPTNRQRNKLYLAEEINEVARG